MSQRADAQQAELSWSVRRGGDDLVISIVAPHRGGERGFRTVDVPESAGRATPLGPLAALMGSLTRARQAGGTVAIQGFAAPRSAGGMPLTFVLAVSLADIPYPEAAELPERNVETVQLQCGPAIRLRRLARIEQGTDRPLLTQFTATYLVATDHGVLALAFATPHADGAPEFALLFDSIAASCELRGQSAPSTPAT
jgi:hypothetical protein